MKILIVEDEKLLADSLRAMLEGKGFAVEAVYDGETGAEYAETGVYDLLILDVMMPGLDGYQVARQVRARRCGTPILMLTARSSLEDRIEGLNAGADYYLTKPFDARELLACIGALLRRPKASPFRGGGSAQPRRRGRIKFAITYQSPSVTASLPLLSLRDISP